MKKQSILPLLSATALAAGLLAPSASMAGGSIPCNHWDKIVFEIESNKFANIVNLPKEQPLDIKVKDSSLASAADLKLEVLKFLLQSDNSDNRKAIKILNVDYAIECPSIPQ